MESSIISLPQRLGKVLEEKAEETGLLPDELAVELLCESLNGELDPEDLVDYYQALSEKYLKATQVKKTLFRHQKNYGAPPHQQLRWRRLRGI